LVWNWTTSFQSATFRAISEELCGHSFSASAISEFNKRLDEELGRFARRELDCEYPDNQCGCEKVRENGVIRSRAVLVAIGIDCRQRTQVFVPNFKVLDKASLTFAFFGHSEDFLSVDPC
jgi:hypothetical protein